MTTPFNAVALVLGAGSNIGGDVGSQLRAAGFLVALVSRSRDDGIDSEGYLNIRADLSDNESIPRIFEKVRSTWGHPNVVIYNGASRTILGADPLSSFSKSQFNQDMAINVTSAVQAAHMAVEGFKKLPSSLEKAFIYTGNKLVIMAKPEVMHFGMGKAAAAHLIWDCSVAYRKNGFKFYFVDERNADGSFAGEARDGPAHAELYLKLIEDQNQGPWYYTFVKGTGYVDFSSVENLV